MAERPGSNLQGNGLPDGILGRIGVTRFRRRFESRLRDHRGEGRRHLPLRRRRRQLDEINDDRRFRQRAWYFSKIYADPKVARHRLCSEHRRVSLGRWRQDFTLLPARTAIITDSGSIRKIRDRLGNANDGGASVSIDGGETWTTQDNQPTAQFYHVAVDNAFPYHIYGAQQDNSNVGIASRGD